MKKREMKEITRITIEGKHYYLCDDSNLYEKNEKDQYILLEGINEESKEIIKKIMDKLKPIETDVISEGNDKKNKNNKKIDVELPEY